MEPLVTTKPSLNEEQFRMVTQQLERQRGALGLGREAFARIEECVEIAAGLRPQPPHDPLQNPKLIYFPGLTAKPFHDSAQFEWAAALENAYPVIRRELQELLDHQEGFETHEQSDFLIKEGYWSSYSFYASGKRNDENCARCPETAKLLDSLPRKTPMGSVKFSVTAPNTHIEPHCAPNNLRIRCHLGMITPEECEIRVKDQIRRWEEGKCLVLDDSFNHEVWNRSDRNRVILLVDFWHQDLTEIEIQVISQLSRVIGINKDDH